MLLQYSFLQALNIGRALILAGLPLPERKRTLPIPEPRGRGGETRLPATPHGEAFLRFGVSQANFGSILEAYANIPAR